MSQIRSFLAIDLDDDFKPKVNKIIKEFKKIDANIKFVDLNNGVLAADRAGARPRAWERHCSP